MNFALTGAAGYVAPRHLKAIRDTGNALVAAVDPHDSVGVLDQYFPDAAFFTEFERFDRHLEKLRRGPATGRIEYISICSPNNLHDAHIRLALRIGADAICEKPLVINPWNLDALQELETETGRRVWTVLQLRVHPALVALKERLDTEAHKRHTVELRYITARGPWYRYSWKGSEERSGGLVANIGVHFFDLLLWLFGASRSVSVRERSDSRVEGTLHLDRADVRWLLSIDRNDLPKQSAAEGASTFRSIVIDGEEIEFSDGFADLHTRVYERTIAGNGFSIATARPAIELVHAIRTRAVKP
jgi:UDP-N-acetyl-2-amino-2-deoxyglucuronate dehydrogenase